MEFTKEEMFQKGGLKEEEEEIEESDEGTVYSDDVDDDEKALDDDDDDDENDDDDDDDDEDDEDRLMEENLSSVNRNMENSNILDKLNMNDDDDDDQDSNDDVDDSDSDDDKDDENYLQKFVHNVDTNNLEKLHPSINACNSEEVMALSRVIRDSKGKIMDPMHTTMPFLTKYEKARIVGARAEQLDRGAIPMIKLDPEIINGRIIAEMELEQKKIPFILARPLPNGKIEYWKLEDLECL